MRKFIPTLILALSVAACDDPGGNDFNIDLANRVEPAPGPDVSARAPSLTLTPAQFGTGAQVAAHGSFAQPVVVSAGLGCPDPVNQGRSVDPDRSYAVVVAPLNAAGEPDREHPLASTSLPYENAAPGTWQDKDFPSLVAPGAPKTGRAAVELWFVQHYCEYKNSVGIPKTGRTVIVSLPYRYTCPGGPGAAAAERCRYVREDGAG